MCQLPLCNGFLAKGKSDVCALKGKVYGFKKTKLSFFGDIVKWQGVFKAKQTVLVHLITELDIQTLIFIN